MNKVDKVFCAFALAVGCFYTGAIVEGSMERKQNIVIPLARSLREARTFPLAREIITQKYNAQSLNQDLAYTEYELSTEEEKAQIQARNLGSLKTNAARPTPSTE